MSVTQRFKPAITVELLEYLNKIFPPQKIEAEDNLQQIYFDAGSRRVVDFLQNEYTKQQKEVN